MGRNLEDAKRLKGFLNHEDTKGTKKHEGV